MESIQVAVKAIVPITAIIFLGVFSRRKSIVKRESLVDFNKVVFNFCLPLSLFESIVNADLSQALNGKLIAYCLFFILLVIFLSMIGLKKTRIDRKRQGVIVQALYRSNFVILGIPIVESIYGEGNIGVTSVLVAALVPFLNVAAVIVLQNYTDTEADLKKTIRALFKNPMILGALAGVVILIMGIELPELVYDTINSMTKMTTPLALFILGGMFEFQSLSANKKTLGIIALLRLFVIPLAGLGGAVLMSFRGVELVSMLVLFGGPVAVASYPMAQQMGLDEDLAAQAVLTTTILVLFSLFLFITLFSQLGLL